VLTQPFPALLRFAAAPVEAAPAAAARLTV